MKKTLLIFSLLLGAYTFASGQRSFYVSESGFDTNDGLTPATAWHSILKVNASFAMMGRGDRVLFKRGNTFYGTILPMVSGITFGAFGTGARPVITGLTTISDWKSSGKNIWEATVPGNPSTLNIVVLKEQMVPMGRYPDRGAVNNGYLTYENFVNNSSITDRTLTSAPDWTGAEVVIRQSDFVLKRLPVKKHTGNTLSFNGNTELNAGYGYFIQNHLAALTRNGEWMYDEEAHKIKIFYTGTPPKIQVSTLVNLVAMMFNGGNRRSDITFKGLAFKGSEGVSMNVQFCDRITVDSCDFSFAGVDAIDHRNMNYFRVSNCAFTDINMNGIHETNPGTGNHISIENNSFRRIGLNQGMISTNPMYASRQLTAVNIGAGNLIIKGNTFDSIGYIAISLMKNRDNQVVRKNKVSNFCLLLNDGGGIYNSGLRGDRPATNVIIDSNIICRSGDATAGTSSTFKHVRAIYLDATSNSVSVLSNTIFNVFEGIYISQAQNIIIRNNTVYDAGFYTLFPKPLFAGALSINDATDGYQHTRNNIITNNTFIARYPNQLLYLQADSYSDADSVGIVDSNYYVSPMNDYPVFLTKTTHLSVANYYSLKMWRAKYSGYDEHSKGSSIKIPAFKVNNIIGKNKLSNEFFTGDIAGIKAESTSEAQALAWDKTAKITGPGSLKIMSAVKSSNFTSTIQKAGRVDSAKKYVLKFKTKATELGSFQTHIREQSGCYCITSPLQRGSIDTAIQEHEILLSWDHADGENAALFINFSHDAGTIYIDDMQLFEANATPVNMDDYIRFEYNATDSPITIKPASTQQRALNQAVHTGGYTLQPFSSVILLKDALP